MTKGTKAFTETIQNKLNEIASKDSLFAESLKKENKTIEGCISYIFKTVQESGCSGFTDDEVYNMAIHYYDEDDIEETGRINGNVIVNHHIELTEEEKDELREQARNDVLNEERMRLHGKEKKIVPAVAKSETQTSLF